MTLSSATLRDSRPPAPRRLHLLALAVFVTLLAVYGSFVPLEFHSLDFDTAVKQFREIRYLDLGVAKRADWVANILLFVPLGFFWLGAIDLDRRSRVVSVIAAVAIIAALAGLAVAIEFGQQWTVRRTVSQNDIIAECIGGGAGVAIWFLVGRWCVARLRDLMRTDGDVPPVKRLLQLYAVAFVVYCVQPLDVAFSPEVLRAKFHPIEGPPRVMLMPFGHTYKGPADLAWQVMIDVLLFVPIGMMLRINSRKLRPIVIATLMGAGFAVCIEVAQLFVYSRFTDVTDVITSTLGAFIGALLAPILLSRATGGENRQARLSPLVRDLIAAGLIGVYFVPLAAAFWHPYVRVASREEFIANLNGLFTAPFKAYYFGSEFGAMTNMLRGLMMFAPIGALLRWAAGPRSRVAAMLICVAVAVPIGLVIEVVQAGLHKKIADVTDIAIYLTGAVAGWIVAQLVLRESDDSRDLRATLSR